MGMMVSFAASIIMTPFYLIFLWDFFQAYFEAISSMTSGTADPAIFVSMVKSLGFGIGILSGISSIIQLVVTPLYSVVMYFDLRARKGEFSQPAAGITIP
jgi:hypothetical protein